MMLSHQRSTCFLLECSRVQGADFVEMLRLIGYPGAGELKGEDFDWLCEIEEADWFVAWLCGSVDQRNSLSDEQLEAYQALMTSGQQLLDADDLQSLSADDRDWDMENGPSLEELEEEVQSLRSLRTHRLHSRNKMESLELSLLRNRLSLEKWEKKEEKNLSHVKEGLIALNARGNTALDLLRKMSTEIEELHTARNAPCLFISYLNLKSYMDLEEACFEQVEEWARALLPQKKEDIEKHKQVIKEKEEEAERLRTAWSSQRAQQILAVAAMRGKEEALRWLQSRGEEEKWYDPLKFQSLEREVQSLQEEIDTLQFHQLPVLLTDISVGPCLAIAQRLQDTEERRLAWTEHVQTPVTILAIRRLSRMQLIEMGLYLETKLHQHLERDLQRLKEEMEQKQEELEKRVLGLRLPSQWLPLIRIDSRDHMAVRLSVILPDPSHQLELFPKYEALQRRATALFQEIVSLKGRLQNPIKQTQQLEQECDDLYRSLCCGTQNLKLRDPNLTLAFEKLSSYVSQFNQSCLDSLKDLENKKQSLHTSRHNKERQLYVHFYKDPTQLVKIIEDLEKRVREISS
ncbi:HAUS augmin-like complex subunit 3 [Discoglossus pictus]